MKRGSACRTQSHQTTQAWVNSVPASFIFSSSPLSLCVPPKEWWKVNSEMMDRRLAERRWADRCREQGTKPGWAQPLLELEGKKNHPLSLPLLLCRCYVWVGLRFPRLEHMQPAGSLLRIVQNSQKLFFLTSRRLWDFHLAKTSFFSIFNISVLNWWLSRTGLMKVGRTILLCLIQWRCSWLHILLVYSGKVCDNYQWRRNLSFSEQSWNSYLAIKIYVLEWQPVGMFIYWMS